MLVNQINLKEMILDISLLISKKSNAESNPNRKNMAALEEISKKIQKKYIKTFDSETVIDLVNTVSNNNDIIDLKPNSLLELIKENKQEIRKILKKEINLLLDLVPSNIFQNLLSSNHHILRDYIKNNKKTIYSLLYENNPEKYNNIINLHSIYFSEDVSKEAYILPLIEKYFLDDSIPEGWELCHDKETKSYYYYNQSSDKSVWENPSFFLWEKKIQNERDKKNNKKVERNRQIKNNNESNNLTVLLDIEDIEPYLESKGSPLNNESSDSSNSSDNSPFLRRSPRIRDLTKRKNNQNLYNTLYDS